MRRTVAVCALNTLLMAFPFNMAEASIRACRENPENCTPAELCSDEILGRYGALSWSYRKHAEYAAKLGLPCAPKKPTAPIQSSPLKIGFNFLSKENRIKIQENLSLLGYYSSSLDGLFGTKTSLALVLYNRKHLDALDLQSHANVNILLTSILSKGAKRGLLPEAQAEPNPPPTQQLPTPKVATPSAPVPVLVNVGSGTGFVVSANGHIVSNAHVVNLCEEVRAHLPEREARVTIITQDIKNDLSILKMDIKPDHVFSLSSSSPFPLQEIVVVGFPFGDSVSSAVKFTRGIVSAVAGLGNDFSQVQVDAAMQPGNSGGPILDEFGNVLAVAVSKLSLKATIKDYGVIPENINFGIKASVVKTLLEGNGIVPLDERRVKIEVREMAESATKGVVRLSCWMTQEGIRSLSAKD